MTERLPDCFIAAIAAIVWFAGAEPASACKSAGSFFDYRNCEVPQTAATEPRRMQAAPAPSAPIQRRMPNAGQAPVRSESVAVIPYAPSRAAPVRPDAARQPVSIPLNVVTGQTPPAPPARPGGTRLVDVADGAGRRLTFGCVGGEAVLYVEFATKMSDQGFKKEVYYTVDGGEPQILELEMSRRDTVMGVWQGYRAAPLVSRFLTARNLAVEATSADGDELLLSFRMTMEEAERALLKKSCPV